MKEKLINAALWMSGRGPWLWNLVDGYKTYSAVAVKVLTALAGLIGEAQPLLDAHNLGGLAVFCQHLSTDQNWKMITDAWLALGLGHKIDKAGGSSAPADVAPAAPPPPIELKPAQ